MAAPPPLMRPARAAANAAARIAAAPVTDGQAASTVKPFPEPQEVPGAGVSQTFITNQLHLLAADHKQYKRSVIDAAAAQSKVVCADFQHDPTKHVHANGGRCYTGIFNMFDIKTGEHPLPAPG
jgi:hypothetical protein